MNDLTKAKVIMEATMKEAQRIAASGSAPTANDLNSMKTNVLGAIAYALIDIAEKLDK